ncbi:MAG: class I SAM-dependent methyltransferase [Candidatus Nitrosopelagicus sp.]|nr:class I SAM-dependent methyltransferase [Candidatus Nitrosopelagicus sp.]
MDNTSANVAKMYKKYPYPFPSSKIKNVNELLNLFKFFSLENSFNFNTKNILDAGSGTGHRIINVARHYKKSNFLGIDFSDNSIRFAKELAKKNEITNIEFRKANLLEKIDSQNKFDVILSMGVLHHLSDPEKGLKNILSVLQKKGVLFLYLYGKLGGHERMIKKKIIMTLLKNKSNYEDGIKIIKKLQFDDLEYGWNIDSENEKERDSVIVDAYLHANEKLYDCEDIDSLLQNSGIFGYSIFGITTKTQGLLFSTELNLKENLKTSYSDVTRFFSSKFTQKFYNSLNVKEKCKIVELFYEPNGYTIVGLTKQMYDSLDPKSRIRKNFIKC